MDKTLLKGALGVRQTPESPGLHIGESDKLFLAMKDKLGVSQTPYRDDIWAHSTEADQDHTDQDIAYCTSILHSYTIGSYSV